MKKTMRILALILAMAMVMGCVSVASAAEKKGKIRLVLVDNSNVPLSQGDVENNRWTNWVKENAPVEIEYIVIPAAQRDETLMNLFAAGDGPDYFSHGNDPGVYIQNDLIMEITDEMLEKVPNYVKQIEMHPFLNKVNFVNGARLGFGGYEPVRQNHTFTVRGDWMDNLGISAPTTVDELFDMIYAFTYNDPDGNGVDDTWGTTMTTDGQRIYAHMFGFPNPEKYTIDKDNNLSYAWDNAEAWLTFVKKVVDAGCVNPDFVTMKADDDMADFLNGRVGIWASGRPSTARGVEYYHTFKELNPDGYWTSFSLPETEFGQFTPYIQGGGGLANYISADCENVDAVLEYVNWRNDPATFAYLNFGPEGEYYQKDEYGTYRQVCSNEKLAEEFSWSPFISVGGIYETYEEEQANMLYNIYLTSEDPITREFGELYYLECQVANEPDVPDPRRWQQNLPTLPTDLNVLKGTLNNEVNGILNGAIGNKDITAAEAIAQAKDTWIKGGGEKVDQYYADFYKSADEHVYTMWDYNTAKVMPILTPAAAENITKAE